MSCRICVGPVAFACPYMNASRQSGTFASLAMTLKNERCISTRTRGEPNNYNRITFDGDEVTIQLRAWDGAQFVDDNTKTYRRSSATRELRKVP